MQRECTRLISHAFPMMTSCLSDSVNETEQRHSTQLDLQLPSKMANSPCCLRCYMTPIWAIIKAQRFTGFYLSEILPHHSFPSLCLLALGVSHYINKTAKGLRTMSHCNGTVFFNLALTLIVQVYMHVVEKNKAFIWIISCHSRTHVWWSRKWSSF